MTPFVRWTSDDHWPPTVVFVATQITESTEKGSVSHSCLMNQVNTLQKGNVNNQDKALHK